MNTDPETTTPDSGTSTTPSAEALAGCRPSSTLVECALAYAGKCLADDRTGHDLHHVKRVFRMAQRLATAESADLETVELIAALHDVSDFKFTGDENSGSREANRWLLAQGVDEQRAELVASNVAGISFKGAGTRPSPLTLEGECVQDADRLDALGAIGIARCFTYGGAKGRDLHDPSVPVQLHANTKQYLNHQGTSVNHFYEKLLLLKDRLNTASARAIAEQRHAFMEAYLEQFYAEWESSA